MKRWFQWLTPIVAAYSLASGAAHGQIDPERRDLLQVGFNAPFEGHPPLAGYAFYYRNQPEFLATNLTLRLAVAPVYVDSELGIRGALGAHTDLGISLAGGGWADSYQEIRRGTYLPGESFFGDTVEAGLSVYHLFNPDQRIPLYAVVRTSGHFAGYSSNDDTAPGFQVPEDRTTFTTRAGLRWGGREPTLFPDLAMELSVWHEGMFRFEDASYGFAGDPRRVEPDSHLFWANAFLAYTLPESHHRFEISLMAGTSLDPDRFSAYRLGGMLPLASEYPLSLPGYFYQEISARQFALLSGSYLLPLDGRQRWNLDVTAATALVDYLPGLEQPGDWHTGLGAGLMYRTDWSKVMIGYGYGVDALRTHGRGAQSVGIWMQFDLRKSPGNFFNPSSSGPWRGLKQFFGLFGG